MVRRALAVAWVALGACGSGGRPPARPPAAHEARPLDWLPAELVTAVRASGTGAPMLAFFARSPRRPPCADAVLAGVRESLQLQRAPGERMALVLVGALDRDALEACGIEAARALLGVEVRARRDGTLTTFAVASPGGALVAGFEGDRAVLADTAAGVRRILHPPRALGPADPLGPLAPRLASGDLAAITTIDHLAPWTRVPAIASTLQLARGAALHAPARVRYAGPAEARRAHAALERVRAGAADAPPAIRRALALLEPVIDGAEITLDLAPLFAPEHAKQLQGMIDALISPVRPP